MHKLICKFDFLYLGVKKILVFRYSKYIIKYVHGNIKKYIFLTIITAGL